MKEKIEADKSMEDTTVSTKSTEHRSTRKKSVPKISTDEAEVPTKTPEKKRKAPKISSIKQEHIDDIKSHEDDTQIAPPPDQEVPVKSKKKHAPKIETNEDSISSEQPIKKKKSKAPKPPPPPLEDDFQLIETPAIEEWEAPIEQKPKRKKSKKSTAAISDSLEDLQITNLNDIYSPNSEINVETNTDDIPPSSEIDASEYEKAILDCFNNLASKINFAEYVGNDQWCIIHLPKAARTEPKSRLRKMLPGGSKDEKPSTKPPVPKGSIFKRIRTGVNMLVRDENNLLFGERANFDAADYEDDPDGVDTDDLHRYAQKLRELEDQDREVNPEFLVLRDGKTVYGVHESDADGKVKLATRKPIYDRFADQKPDEQSGKRKLLSRLKISFTRSKDKEDKDSKSANTTPDPHARRKSGRKSLNDDLTTTTTTTMINDDPLMI